MTTINTTIVVTLNICTSRTVRNRLYCQLEFLDGNYPDTLARLGHRDGDDACQYSPRTRIWPSGASAVSAVPVSPTMPSLPVTTLLRRARTTSETSVAVMMEKGSASAMAVDHRMRNSGRAVHQHDRAQHHG